MSLPLAIGIVVLGVAVALGLIVAVLLVPCEVFILPGCVLCMIGLLSGMVCMLAYGGDDFPTWVTVVTLVGVGLATLGLPALATEGDGW